MKNFKKHIISRIKGIVPRHISNKIIVTILNVLTLASVVGKRRREKNFLANKKQWDITMRKACTQADMIENQMQLGAIAMGKSNLAYSGCEIIAIYNFLNQKKGGSFMELPELIYELEKHDLVAGGMWGMSPGHIIRYLKKMNMDVRASYKQREFKDIANHSESFILTFYNNKYDIFEQIHTVYVTKEPCGIRMHNGGSGYSQCFTDYEDMLGKYHGGLALPICIIGLA